MEIIVSELVVVTREMIHRLEPDLDMNGPVRKCVYIGGWPIYDQATCG